MKLISTDYGRCVEDGVMTGTDVFIADIALAFGLVCAIVSVILLSYADLGAGAEAKGTARGVAVHIDFTLLHTELEMRTGIILTTR